MTVVVGAGLAGLATARHLTRNGVDVTVLEGSDGVGGRVRTDVVDGFPPGSRIPALQPGLPRARLAGARIVVSRGGRRRVERVADPGWGAGCAVAPRVAVAATSRPPTGVGPAPTQPRASTQN